MKRIAAAAIAVLGAWSTGAAAQTPPPPPQEEILGPAPAATGPDWWAFSRGGTRHYLVDLHSIARTGDEVTMLIARVPLDLPAGDLSHTIDTFGVRCSARQSHVVSSTDALEDGVLGEAYPTDEPWEPIPDGSLDEAILDMGCEGSRPQGRGYPTIRAYMDAGRP